MNTKRWSLIGALALLLALFTGGAAHAAEFVGQDVYRLDAGETIADDLYVTASEIYIDGTIDGDLIASGGIVEINGVVTGDALLAGAGVYINGEVQDDVRVAGAGVEINGVVGDDVIAAAGGNPSIPGSFGMGEWNQFAMGNRTVTQGLRFDGNIGGDLVLAGGTADLAGVVEGNVWGGVGELNLDGTFDGDVTVEVGQLDVGSNTTIAGTLAYESDAEAAIPAGAAGDVEFTPSRDTSVVVQQERGFFDGFVGNLLRWGLRTVALLIGFAALGWLVMRIRPQWITGPAAALSAEPGKSAGFGCLSALGFIFIPLISGLLVFLVALFWGWWQATILFFFLFSALALLWIFSPLITGYWLGSRFGQTPVVGLLIGSLLIVLIGRIPILGWFIYLVSFVLALGGIVTARTRGNEVGEPPAKAPPAPAG
jgi:cytoskeletal protein CcmA (bactofilin family)